MYMQVYSVNEPHICSGATLQHRRAVAKGVDLQDLKVVLVHVDMASGTRNAKVYKPPDSA